MQRDQSPSPTKQRRTCTPVEASHAAAKTREGQLETFFRHLDLEQAQQLLAEVGWGSGKEVLQEQERFSAYYTETRRWYKETFGVKLEQLPLGPVYDHIYAQLSEAVCQE